MTMTGKLSVVATPIGNLEDMTLRAIRTLKEADVIFCEDTRVTGKLLKHYDIEVPMRRCDAEKEEQCAELALELIQEEKHIAYVSDAGTPGISDPGARLVAAIREQLPECTIEAIPGASALTAALSVAGIHDTDFVFLGFLPHKKGRETLFREIADSKRTVVFYESPHRILKTLNSLEGYLTINRKVVVARELTKMHEEIVRGNVGEVQQHFLDNSDTIRGEFVVLIESTGSSKVYS